MKTIYFLILPLVLFIACNDENSLKRKELELKEKELQIRERELQQKELVTVNTQYESKTPSKRKLRYLFYSNGGLIGYFNDGTVAGCPRCDLITENIKALYSSKPFKKYQVEDDGTLLVDGNEKEYPKEEDENGNQEWAMIDYKWLVDL